MMRKKALPVVLLLLLSALLLLVSTEYWAFFGVDSYLGGLMGRNDTSDDLITPTNRTLPVCSNAPRAKWKGNGTHQVIVKNVGTPRTSGRLVHGPDQAKVLVMTSCGPPTPYLDVSIKNKMLYAQLHQYDFRWMVETFTLRPISQWGKMIPILEGLGGGRNIVAGEQAVPCQYEWIIWFDCDSLVARMDMGIEEVAGEFLEQPDAQILLGKDPNGWNSGVMALRCSDWNLALFKRIWDQPVDNSDAWAEQRILIRFIDTDAEVRNRVKFVPQERIQYGVNFPLHRVPDPEIVNQYSIHFPGGPQKTEMMKKYYRKAMERGAWMMYKHD